MTSLWAVTPNFTIPRVAPVLPIIVSLSPGLERTFRVGILVPDTSYAGPLTIDVVAIYG